MVTVVMVTANCEIVFVHSNTQLHSVKRDPSDPRPVPRTYTCIDSILPNAPDPVTEFVHAKVSYTAVNNTMTVDVVWEEPVNTYGSVLYGIYIGTRPIDPSWPLDMYSSVTPPRNALLFKAGLLYMFWYGVVRPLGPVAVGDTVFVQVRRLFL